MRASLNKSLHGRPITVTTSNPNVTPVHIVQPVTQGHANVQEVHLELSNPGTDSVIVEVHYNNGALYVTVPAKDTWSMDITLEGDSPNCGVANSTLAVTLDSAADVGAQINVAGGVK